MFVAVHWEQRRRRQHLRSLIVVVMVVLVLVVVIVMTAAAARVAGEGLGHQQVEASSARSRWGLESPDRLSRRRALAGGREPPVYDQPQRIKEAPVWAPCPSRTARECVPLAGLVPITCHNVRYRRSKHGCKSSCVSTSRRLLRRIPTSGSGSAFRFRMTIRELSPDRYGARNPCIH